MKRKSTVANRLSSEHEELKEWLKIHKFMYECAGDYIRGRVSALEWVLSLSEEEIAEAKKAWAEIEAEKG